MWFMVNGKCDRSYTESRITEALSKLDIPDYCSFFFFFGRFSSLFSSELSPLNFLTTHLSLIFWTLPLLRYDIIPWPPIFYFFSLLLALLLWFNLLPWVMSEFMILKYAASVTSSFLGRTSHSSLLLWPSDSLFLPDLKPNSKSHCS